MHRTTFDAIVVGAGPAGSAAAALLAERGCSVALVERAEFPRPKPCAEYLSPEAARVLDRLGLTDTLQREGAARLRGMRVVSPGGTAFTGRFAGARPFRGYHDYGLALPREVLDAHLAAAAVERGAVLLERTSVEGISAASSRGRVVAVRCGDTQRALTGRVVIGADGLNSRVARVLGVARRGRRRRLALVTHYEGVAGMGDVGEMHVGPASYVGLAPVGRGLTNVAVVADLRRVTPRGPLEDWMDDLLRAFPTVRERLGAGGRATPVRAAGPFARTTRRATDDRAILVGDAADFYDPFTGEGIYAALRGAELAAEQVARGLEADRLGAADLAPYDRARRREFAGKWIVERVVSWMVAHPASLDHVARRFADKPGLADLLVGVTGDFVPPAQVLKPSYVWRLVT
jgi:geranylgeranyl reductase family protein